ncbi:restriction endonuclease subunit S [Faecalibaculum rodentium]|uniref:restriction endonuclease subunit S n=3 Tax=Faecalibaculum rodentium TaxID=1702221 RepID=UPI00266F0E96|nr:restriction endonuclease subunit S [Faecalibaculum rodentium]
MEYPVRKLNELVTFRREVANCHKATIYDYISTENMLSDRGGVVEATNVPAKGKVKIFNKGDILISNIRPYFKKILKAKFDGYCSSDVLVLTPVSLSDEDYLYGVLSADTFFDYVTKTSKGTKMPRGDIDAIRNYSVPWPDHEMRTFIGEVYSTIDKKLDANKLINKNLLEQLHLMVSEVYRNPSFELKPISVIADVIDCLHSKKPYPVEDGYGQLIQLDNIRDDGFLDMRNSTYFISKPDFENWTRKLIISPGDFVITNVGRVGAVAMAPAGTKAAMGRNMTAIRLKHDSQYYSYFFAVMTSKEMRREIRQRTDVGTIMNALNVKDIPNLRIPISSEQQMRGIEKTFKSFVEQIEANNLENQFLSAVRDSLLPKLLSGTIELS